MAGRWLQVCDDRFSLAIPEFSENVQTGGGGRVSSVETTRLARTETRHDFLAHGDLLRVSLYGRQGRDSVWVHNRLLCAERSNTQHARVKTKTVIIKAVQGTCLRTSWCEVLLLHISQYLNMDTKERKSLFEVKRKLLRYSICFYDGKNLKIKRRMQ